MKKPFTLSIVLIFSILYLLTPGSAFAQSARVQWINNVSAVGIDSIDIYIDGTITVDNLHSRSATTLTTLSSGTHTIHINRASSTDTSDLLLNSFSVSIQNNSNTSIMVMGVDTPANYASNPSSRSTAISLVIRKGIVYSTSNASLVAVSVCNGVSDYAGLYLTGRPASPSFAATNLRYLDTTANQFPVATDNIFDLKDASGNILKTYKLPLSSYAKKSITLFTSGFMTPSANMNGAPFGMYFVDTNGGQATALAEIARVQFFNASPDIILDTVDIWIDTLKVVSKLGFRAISSMMTVNPGTYDITVTKKSSPDTTGTNVVYRIPGFTISPSVTYLGLITGVVDTSIYSSNPDYADRRFMLSMLNTYAETAPASNQIRVLAINAVPDGSAKSLQRNPSSPVTIMPDASYNAAPASAIINTGTLHVILQKTGSTITNSFRLSIPSTYSTKSGILISTGFEKAAGNPAGAASKLATYSLIFSDGSSLKVEQLDGYFQLVHGSSDVTAKSFKVFLNGAVLIDTLKFRTGTPFLRLVPFTSSRFHLAPQSATDTSTAYTAFTLTPDSGKYYYGVASGLLSTTGYAANPSGVDRSFTVVLKTGARKTALFNTKNVDLMYFHSISDAPATSIRGAGQIVYLSKDDVFKAYHGYNAHTAFDALMFDVRETDSAGLLFTCMANLTDHKGKAGLVVASGFLNPANNQNGDSAMLFVTWPDGETDTLPSPLVGIKPTLSATPAILIYPNPASESLTIDTKSLHSGHLGIELTDLTGHVLWTGTNDTNKIVTLSIANFATGLYLVRCTGESGSWSQKLVITR